MKGLEDTGGPGAPVVLIHAFPLSRAMWRPQLAALGRSARLIAYDVRGFGQAEAGAWQHTVETWCDDLLAALAHAKAEKAVVCGLSMGGYIALRFAERHPERLAGLVLCDTKSEADADEARLKRAAGVAQIQKDGLPAFAGGFLKGALGASTQAKRPAVAAEVRALIEANDPRGVCAGLLAMAARTDTTAKLGRLTVPTAVVVGSEDSLTPPAAAKAMAERIPGAEYHIVPEAGHLSSLENPEAFNARLSAFLRRVR